jgi:endoglucanase
VQGTKLKGSKVQPDWNVQLRGMSLFWSEWMSDFYNYDVVRAIKCSWNSNVVRAAMGVDDSPSPTSKYLLDGDQMSIQMNLVNKVVQAAIDLGIYVIIDWHAYHGYKDQAVWFFQQMAQHWGAYPNVLYEIFNEPQGADQGVTWNYTLVPYHTAIINAIRTYDKNNVIILGTTGGSHGVVEAAQNPITWAKNVVYTLHFYAGTDSDNLRNQAQVALDKGLPIFVSEYGTVNEDGNGAPNIPESNNWWGWLDWREISYLNWDISNKDEGSAALLPNTSATYDGVSSNSLTQSGWLVKNKYNTQNNGVRC